eukprot:6222644-Ditylum_brightwellii.AAC.1
MSSDDKNIFSKENGFNSVPDEIIKSKKGSKPSIQDIIELPDLDSDSSALIARPFKKIKQESSINNFKTIFKKEVTGDDAKSEAAVMAATAAVVTAATDKAKRDLS